MACFPHRLYNIMVKAGWGQKKRQRPSEIQLLEYITDRTAVFRRVFGGSFGEGTDIPGSDQDFMGILANALAVFDASEIDREKNCFLICQEGHRSCYPSLKLLCKGTAELDNLAKLLSQDENFEKTSDGSMFLSSEKIANKMVELSHTAKLSDVGYVSRHGPCAKTLFNRSVSMPEHEIETAYSISCIAWPTQAAEWTDRPRSSGWPTPELVSRVTRTGCTLVPLGNPYSDLHHLEWRISFLVGERELIWSLNEMQFFSFVIIKYILKNKLDPKFPDRISTFHMKTILFWLLEDSGVEMWTKDNLLHCIKCCFERLLEHVQKKHLPHYFARENNIFTGKFESEDENEALKKEIEYIVSKPEEVIHICLDIKCIKSSCLLCKDKTADNETEEERAFFPECLSSYWLKNYSSAFIQSQCDTWFRRLTLTKLGDLKEDWGSIPNTVLHNHREIVGRVLDGRRAITAQKHALLDVGFNEEQKAALFCAVEAMFESGTHKDELAGKLHQATFYYVCGDMDEALRCVRSVDTEVDVFHYIGTCSGSKLILNRQCENPAKRMVELGDRLAYDIGFVKEDFECVPEALQYECLLFDDVNDDIRIHPIVYMYFLLTCIFMRKKEIESLLFTLSLLEKSVRDTRGGRQRDIALNITGYCFALVRDDEKAVEYFWNSYQVRPSIINPCLYHTVAVLHRRIETEKNKKQQSNEKIEIIYSRV